MNGSTLAQRDSDCHSHVVLAQGAPLFATGTSPSDISVSRKLVTRIRRSGSLRGDSFFLLLVRRAIGKPIQQVKN
jgi:hypothetical protein